MKHANKLIVILLLALVLSACGSGPVRTVEVTRVVPQTVVVTEAVQQTTTSVEGGFTTGTPIDVSTLPALAGVGTGDGGGPCFVESAEPSISWGYGISPNEILCLNNFPAAPASPGVTVTLTDPAGHTFSETFTYNQDKVINSTGTDAGHIQEGSDSKDYPATPGVSIKVYMPANFSCGDWAVSANTQDGEINIGPTTLTVKCPAPRLSVLPDLSINPFISPEYSREGPTSANGETIYIVGTAYPPNTAITVALYQEDPSAGKPEVGYMLATARYAVSVMTDNAGNLQAPFVIGNGTQRGAYYVVAAPVITTNIYLSHFSERFSIE